MLNIQTKDKTVKDEDGKNRTEKYIVVNGIEDKESDYYNFYDLPSAHVYDEEVIKLLLEHSFKEIGNFLTSFQIDMEFDWWESWLMINVYCSKHYDDKIPTIKIDMQLQEWEHWNKPWSMSTLAKELERNILILNNDKIQYWQDDPDSMLNGFGVEYFPSDINAKVKPEIDSIISLLKIATDETNKSLTASLNSNSVLTYFQFPDEIKTACQQYLVYFAQFIADMGIIVDTELKEEVNQTLFKVTPKDKSESLEKIREALSIYLNAPSEPNFQVQISSQTDIASKQWEANVYHLKSQLILANSVLQANQATIESLQLSNYQYRQMLESHQPKKDSEEVIKGVAAIKKYDGKWFTVDLPEIFRRLKRTFKK